MPHRNTFFYVAGALIGAAGGALQAASRTLLIRQVPKTEVGEAFGLFALTGRATSFIAPLSVGAITSLSQSQQIGITPIIVLFALGALGLTFVTKKINRPAGSNLRSLTWSVTQPVTARSCQNRDKANRMKMKSLTHFRSS